MLVRILLVVPAEDPAADRLCTALSGADAAVTFADGLDRVDEPDWERFADGSIDLLVLDTRLLPPAPEALTALETLSAKAPACEVVLYGELPSTLEGERDSRTAIDWLAAGVRATIDPQLEEASLARFFQRLVIRSQRRRQRLLEESRALTSSYAVSTTESGDLVQSSAAVARSRSALSLDQTRSESMRETLRLAQRVAPSDTSVLLLGESGVGKEWLARAIHRCGPRADRPFLAINCAAVPETLLESTLFGHERGAFTGAERAHRGYFELAHGGTLFLDEIGEMPHAMQTRLLRVLQDGEVRRVGSERSLTVDVRILAATNRDTTNDGPKHESAGLREDLYYRLAVMEIEVPPLRERVEDIVGLFRQELHKKIAGESTLSSNAPSLEISAEAEAALRSYSWPGNVRELINVAERAVLLRDEGPITLEHLPRQLHPERATTATALAGTNSDHLRIELDLRESLDLDTLRRRALEAVERAVLVRLLRQTAGNLSRTARRAGIDPRTLYNKMRTHGLDKADFRNEETRNQGNPETGESD